MSSPSEGLLAPKNGFDSSAQEQLTLGIASSSLHPPVPAEDESLV